MVDVIAGHILATNAPESVVIALNAPWGAGKSSFLNLLEEGLAPAKDDEKKTGNEPIIIRFNPWHYGSIEQLVRMFFAELARGIGTAGRQELGKKIGDLLNAAGAIASVFSSGAGSLLKDAGKTLKEDKGLPEPPLSVTGQLAIPERLLPWERDLLAILLEAIDGSVRRKKTNIEVLS
ncbi:MAG: hypothetical protein JW940_25190 [Polyangiaceae bacterium]|nr:hypothetical protein [Polyangiaceae bacterium]